MGGDIFLCGYAVERALTPQNAMDLSFSRSSLYKKLKQFQAGLPQAKSFKTCWPVTLLPLQAQRRGRPHAVQIASKAGELGHLCHWGHAVKACHGGRRFLVHIVLRSLPSCVVRAAMGQARIVGCSPFLLGCWHAHCCFSWSSFFTRSPFRPACLAPI